MNNKIEIGDTVQVNFNNAQVTLSESAEVIHMPTATGDAWIFKNLYTDEIYYVTEGCTVTKIS